MSTEVPYYDEDYEETWQEYGWPEAIAILIVLIIFYVAMFLFGLFRFLTSPRFAWHTVKSATLAIKNSVAKLKHKLSFSR